jgi:hypothetical protein
MTTEKTVDQVTVSRHLFLERHWPVKEARFCRRGLAENRGLSLPRCIACCYGRERVIHV